MSKKKDRFDEHHRLSRALGGDDSYENRVIVSRQKHCAWHTLFNGRMSLEKIVDELNNKWIRADKKLIIVNKTPPD